MKGKIKVVKRLENNHRSNWHLTINTNKTDVHSNLADFQKAIDYIFNDESIIENWFQFSKGSFNDVISFEIGYPIIEIGTDTGYIHLHTYISIVHKANIKLNLTQIRSDFAKELGYTPYGFFKLVQNYDKLVEDYTIKSLKNK
jgi:hypothetical protein